MSHAVSNSNEGESLDQAAIRCYLSTVLAVTDCMAQVCPDVGMSFKRRWARAPQRLGFEATPAALEGSRRDFEHDLRAFADYTAVYFAPSIPLIEQVAEQGHQVIDTMLDRMASHSVLLQTLGESLATFADTEAPPELRDTLEHQSEGLLRSGRVVEQEVVPLLTQLQSLVRQCEQVLVNSRRTHLVDVETGLLNKLGFERELARRLSDRTFRCMLLLRLQPSENDNREHTDEDFDTVIRSLAPAVFEQFRASESIGYWNRTVAVLFAGTPEQADRRRPDIERRLSGDYMSGAKRIRIGVTMEILDLDRATTFVNAPETVAV